MGDDLWNQIGVQEGLRRYSEIRKRLQRPPNAVRDAGIDLRRCRQELAPQPPTKPSAEEMANRRLQSRISEILSLYPPTSKTLTISVIFNHTALAFGIAPEDIRGRSRRPIFAEPRQAGMYLTRRLLGTSYPRIASHFGMDHTTIMHGIKRVAYRVATDTDLATKINNIEMELLTRYETHNRNRSDSDSSVLSRNTSRRI